MRRFRSALFPTLAALACGGSVVAVRPNIDPASLNRPAVQLDTAPSEPQPILPADQAYARGWMPLGATGVDRFRAANPTLDGRGVVIGILDSGIDPGIAGLLSTTSGERKILDLRDFSGEGAIALQSVTPSGDTVRINGHALGGVGRVRSFSAEGPFYGGVLRERPLGAPPASDVNGNGRDDDEIPVLVTRASDGWVLFTDTDGDGSLQNEAPVHDYLVGHETFGWTTRGRPTPLTVAANFGERDDRPLLDLFFDTSGHGTHVAGIAAGHDMYGVAGFDGVAPGAQLLGLKISNDAQGGITTTGSMIRALDYAIRFAATRRLPLVLNMSFGVGNEQEGAARIDRLVDSLLALHPDVVFAVSAGNDGPGLSTIGFPASAGRVLTIGATFPRVFLQLLPNAPPADPVAYFSSRGGEIAKPDIVTPGMAYSTVPRWHTGEERIGGTSMASPHAAGLAALLVSALRQKSLPIEARAIRQALMVTALPIAGESPLDDGAGQPDVGQAWRWLQGRRAVPDIQVIAPRSDGSGTGAAFRAAGLASSGDTVQEFTLTRPAANPSATYALRSNAAWLTAPPTVTLSGPLTTVRVRYNAGALRAPGVYSGMVIGWSADTLAGPAFRLVNTVVVPYPGGTVVHEAVRPLNAGEERRWFFAVDSGRPFKVAVSTASSSQTALAYLHEPGGQPYRGAPEGISAGFGDDAGIFEPDATDVVGGVYQVVAVAPPNTGAAAGITVTPAPMLLDAARDRDGVVVTLRGAAADSVTARVVMHLVGAARMVPVSARGSAVLRIPFRMPFWASHVTVELVMDKAQWPRFTDFGLTLFDSAGRQIAKEPIDYALGRLDADISGKAGPAEVALFPGFADEASAGSWSARVTIRLYADSSQALESSQGPGPVEVGLAPWATAPVRFAMPKPPWPLGDGFVPLGVLAAQAAGEIWTREVPLPAPGPVLMQ